MAGVRVRGHTRAGGRVKGHTRRKPRRGQIGTLRVNEAARTARTRRKYGFTSIRFVR